MNDIAHNLLPLVGQALWGERWQTDMADALAVDGRTVRRWVAGAPVKPGIWVDLMRLMQERALLLDDLTEQAKRLGGGT